jgi:hypothetical protein
MPEQHETSLEVHKALNALQTAVLAQQAQQKLAGSSTTDSSSISSSLSQLSVCLQDLLQRQVVLGQSLEDRYVLRLAQAAAMLQAQGKYSARNFKQAWQCCDTGL